MNHFQFSLDVISRRLPHFAEFNPSHKAHSAVEKAAEITGSKLHETRRNLSFNGKKATNNILFHKTLAPNHAPVWMRENIIWDYLESYEDQIIIARYQDQEALLKYMETAEIAATISVNLPLGLSSEKGEEIAINFAQETLVSRDLIVTVAIQNDSVSPKAHFLFSLRKFTPEGHFSLSKDREILSPGGVRKIRDLWAEKTQLN